MYTYIKEYQLSSLVSFVVVIIILFFIVSVVVTGVVIGGVVVVVGVIALCYYTALVAKLMPCAFAVLELVLIAPCLPYFCRIFHLLSHAHTQRDKQAHTHTYSHTYT